MKKLITLLIMAVAMTVAVSARDRVSRDVRDLPKQAQITLSKNFPKNKISHIKIDSHLIGGDDYDVILDNGTEVEFDSEGKWKEVDCGSNAVPQQFVIKPIRDYVSKNFKGQKIVKIEVSRNEYEVELINGLDLKFDRAGKFKSVDD